MDAQSNNVIPLQASFEHLYNTTKEMLNATADFLDSDGRSISQCLTPIEHASFGTVSITLTTLLMETQAILMTRESLMNGEITLADVARHPRLNVNVAEVCREDDLATVRRLAPRLIDLLNRARCIRGLCDTLPSLESIAPPAAAKSDEPAPYSATILDFKSRKRA